jgi:hypothetical protein
VIGIGKEFAHAHKLMRWNPAHQFVSVGELMINKGVRQGSQRYCWIPAFAGMTVGGRSSNVSRKSYIYTSRSFAAA